ncbi:class III extradiol dioxygenase subunit B-like domain-containing protein [Antrihabitans sp. YC2-6]|uniref:class III extradiol dioxygenase subunit B-like domain-containing protein n=1 Tax=Antrihabitans sp. YC2-6 TaxID=2799498 RepID=UPI0018F55F15|nr:class III extradiol dioxygenase subunit B-like domain-containing protein [Antrihabitans sp. YC2-6]MBJ8345020.1 class III extradiol dioxygenase subunit B-like domain-containing protein [Antrihabitans sp. YC2-6]
MFTAAALVPSPPILVPELNGADPGNSAELRAAAIAVASELGAGARKWTVVGVGETEETLGPDGRGTFRGFGKDVEVALSDRRIGRADPKMPLAALIAGWLRGVAAPGTSLECRVLAVDTSPIYCAQLGSTLRRELDDDPEPHGLLVVADGATTLTAKAPGSFDERAPEFQADLDRALTDGDYEFLAQLDPVVCIELGVSGRAAWQVLAAVFAGRPTCKTLYSAAPFGVGYHVGTWTP